VVALLEGALPRLERMSPVTAPSGHRDRLLAAAARFTAAHGWAALTMGKLADLGGVSRQTVYNEIGGKPQLAEAMVMRELALFLDVVDGSFADNPLDLVAAIQTAAERVLEMAGTDPLLHAVISSSQGADTELLPLLTTNSGALLIAAGQMIRGHVESYDLALPEHRMDGLIDTVVRLVLSHVMQPAGSPRETAETVAWIARRVLQD
jgi:AcrR family transcriptional regulator